MYSSKRPKWKRNRAKGPGAAGLRKKGREKMSLKELAGLESLVDGLRRRKKKGEALGRREKHGGT